MASTKWAIMVCLDGKDDWIFVTETTNDCWDLKPLLFERIEDAMAYAETFHIPGKEPNVQVVDYNYED
jgi:hypothetical protein